MKQTLNTLIELMKSLKIQQPKKQKSPKKQGKKGLMYSTHTLLNADFDEILSQYIVVFRK